LNLVTGATPKVTIKPTGSVGIGTTTPMAALDVQGGDINTSGKVTRTTTGLANLVPIAYGYISAGGGVLSGTGNFSASNPSVGTYNIIVNGESMNNMGYFAFITPNGGAGFGVTTKVQFNGTLLNVYLSDTSGGGGANTNNDFYFIIYKL